MCKYADKTNAWFNKDLVSNMSNYNNYREMAKCVRDALYTGDTDDYTRNCLIITAHHIEQCATQDECLFGDLLAIIEYIKKHPDWED